MRTLRLRTVHNCRQLPCPTCVVAETAFRRALGLAGLPLPERVPEPGRRSEAFLSANIAVEILHDCDDLAAVAHFEFHVDEQPVTLPTRGSARSLQEEFSRILATVEPAPAANS